MDAIGSVVEALQAGVWTLDRDGITTYANQRMHEMLGFETAVLLGRPLLDFVDPADQPMVLQGLRRRGEGRSDSYDARLRGAAGRLVHVRIQASPILQHGTVIGSVAAVTDVSDLASRAAATTAALDQAEQSASSASRLLSWVSHELRTPLNTIDGFAQLLEQGITDPTQRTLVGHIRSATEHVAALARDLLDLARTNSGALEVEALPVSIAEAVADAVTLVDASAREASVNISATVGDAPILGDRRRVVQVLVNLLTNAIRHGGNGRTVTVSTEQGDGVVRCSVTDEGPGVPASERERVFLPFERATTGATGGAGLGLTIADGFARAMGGSITLAPNPAGGATFTLTLPAAPDAADAPGDSRRTQVSEPSTDEPRSGLILYVEDEPLNATLVENIVALLPGRSLRVAPTVAEGITALDAERPALAILDLNLPDGTGFDVLRHIRTDPSLADMPVFILSADATQESALRATELGANRYITKPFDLRQFLDLLEMATRT